MDINTSIELFAQGAKFNVSQNLSETLEKIKTVREEYIELFKKLCIDDKVLEDNMKIQFSNECVNYYVNPDIGHYSIPEGQRINYIIERYTLDNSMTLISTINIVDWGMKEIEEKFEIKDYHDDYTFWMSMSKFFFNKKSFKKGKGFSFDIKSEKAYFIEAFNIKKKITEKDFELLSFFFKEQRTRKIAEKDIKDFQSFKDSYQDENDSKFESGELN